MSDSFSEFAYEDAQRRAARAAPASVDAKAAGSAYVVNINELVQAAHENAVAHGWWTELDTQPNIPEKLALIHSEISEALEEYRSNRMANWTGDHGKPEGFAVELADAVIRIADLCGYLKIDLAKAIGLKHEYNRGRPYRHGGKVA